MEGGFCEGGRDSYSLSEGAGITTLPGPREPSAPMGAAYTAAQSFSFLRPLANDHLLAGVGRFYGGVHHAYVVARPAHGPVEGVAVVGV